MVSAFLGDYKKNKKSVVVDGFLRRKTKKLRRKKENRVNGR